MSDVNGREQDGVTLTPADAAAVDAVLDGAEPGSKVDGGRRERAANWLKVLEGAAAPAAAANLGQRTLDAVRDADRMRIPERSAASEDAADVPAPRPRWRRRMAEFGAMGVAAMLFVSVLIAGLDQAHKSRVRVACVVNMKVISTGMNAYASAAGSYALPTIAAPSNHNWLHGTADGAHDNAANLLPLITASYVPLKSFFCPGTPAAAAPTTAIVAPWDIGSIGYSYRDMTAADKPKWDGTFAIILTDRNPLFADATTTVSPDANSKNHDSRGNNVLHADGSVSWATSPNIGPGNDNIWTIGSGKDRLLSYKGTEMPSALTDIIVCP